MSTASPTPTLTRPWLWRSSSVPRTPQWRVTPGQDGQSPSTSWSPSSSSPPSSPSSATRPSSGSSGNPPSQICWLKARDVYDDQQGGCRPHHEWRRWPHHPLSSLHTTSRQGNISQVSLVTSGATSHFNPPACQAHLTVIVVKMETRKVIWWSNNSLDRRGKSTFRRQVSIFRKIQIYALVSSSG